MKHLPVIVICWILLALGSVASQSGRRSTKPAATPTSTPAVEATKQTPAKPAERDRAQLAAVPNEEYRCMDDGSVGVVVHSDEAEKVFAPNEVSIKAKILSRPKVEYTSEARRRAVEGIVAVRAVLLANGKVWSVKITNRGLPFGLNENAIHAACKMEFTPASKDGQRVSQWLKTEFLFRLESSVFRR